MWYKRDGIIWIKKGVETKPNNQRTEAAILAHKNLMKERSWNK